MTSLPPPPAAVTAAAMQYPEMEESSLVDQAAQLGELVVDHPARPPNNHDADFVHANNTTTTSTPPPVRNHYRYYFSSSRAITEHHAAHHHHHHGGGGAGCAPAPVIEDDGGAHNGTARLPQLCGQQKIMNDHYPVRKRRSTSTSVAARCSALSKKLSRGNSLISWCRKHQQHSTRSSVLAIPFNELAEKTRCMRETIESAARLELALLEKCQQQLLLRNEQQEERTNNGHNELLQQQEEVMTTTGGSVPGAQQYDYSTMMTSQNDQCRTLLLQQQRAQQRNLIDSAPAAPTPPATSPPAAAAATAAASSSSSDAYYRRCLQLRDRRQMMTALLEWMDRSMEIQKMTAADADAAAPRRGRSRSSCCAAIGSSNYYA